MLHVNIEGISFDNCLLNASGAWCMKKTELNELNCSAAGALISKSCSLVAHKGNPEPRYFENDLGTLNSMGLPNEGYKYYSDLIGNFKKPYMISIAGNFLWNNFSILDEINIIVEAQKDMDKMMVEINVSCPNIAGKEQLAYNFTDLNNFLYYLSYNSYSSLILGLKLPPYFDPAHFKQLYNVVTPYKKWIRFLTTMNSVGNALIVDSDTESIVIKPKEGLGGLGGDYIKPIALANIRQLYQYFGTDMKIIGCGGIKTGNDVFQQILCGASLCQIGSQLMKEGPECFSRILKELEEIMQRKKYTLLEDFHGKLKIIL